MPQARPAADGPEDATPRERAWHWGRDWESASARTKEGQTRERSRVREKGASSSEHAPGMEQRKRGSAGRNRSPSNGPPEAIIPLREFARSIRSKLRNAR